MIYICIEVPATPSAHPLSSPNSITLPARTSTLSYKRPLQLIHQSDQYLSTSPCALSGSESDQTNNTRLGSFRFSFPPPHPPKCATSLHCTMRCMHVRTLVRMHAS
ncbi:unnamed protein product [Periconia digitata]|uniref:Uncharacterized protein n=1 Tax=Periconia digitata TaxID=1303443 RepID=A0A9W4UQQ0_9PLEO|nr:unnamed protein product [Periconia digitata]